MYALVIGASDESIYAINKAQEMGYKVIAFDGDENATGLKIADESFVVDIRKPELIYNIIDELDISIKETVVLPVPIGRYLITTGSVNDHYKLFGPGLKSTELCTDKWLFHNTLNAEGLRNARCQLIKAGEKCDDNYIFPVIVKPRFGAGSREVVRISNDKEWIETSKRFPFDEDFIIEDSVLGIEYGLDGIIVDGKFELVLLRKKIITPPPYRQCVGYISVNNNSEIVCKTKQYLSQIIPLMELKNSIIHADIIDNNGELFMIEMSARPSGHRLHNIFTPMVTGVDLIESFLRLSSGADILINPRQHEDYVMIHYFDIEKEIKRIPSSEEMIEKYDLLDYQCNMSIGEICKIKDGHTLMKRGYFIIKDSNENSLIDRANSLLSEYI